MMDALFDDADNPMGSNARFVAVENDIAMVMALVLMGATVIISPSRMVGYMLSPGARNFTACPSWSNSVQSFSKLSGLSDEGLGLRTELIFDP
jgi:hypothetical protein